MKNAHLKDLKKLKYCCNGTYKTHPPFSKNGSYWRDYRFDKKFTFRELYEAIKIIFHDDEKIIVTYSGVNESIKIQWGRSPIVGIKKKNKKRKINKVPQYGF